MNLDVFIPDPCSTEIDVFKVQKGTRQDNGRCRRQAQVVRHPSLFLLQGPLQILRRLLKAVIWVPALYHTASGSIP